jgi:hypothetical protein
MVVDDKEISAFHEDNTSLRKLLKDHHATKPETKRDHVTFPRPKQLDVFQNRKGAFTSTGKRYHSEISTASSTDNATKTTTNIQSAPVGVTSALEMDMSVLEQSVVPRSKKPTTKARSIRSLMEAPNSVDTRGTLDVDIMQQGTRYNSLKTTTSDQMESDPIAEVGSIDVGKVYARSVTADTVEGVARHISVARVSTKKRQETSE